MENLSSYFFPLIYVKLKILIFSNDEMAEQYSEISDTQLQYLMYLISFFKKQTKHSKKQKAFTEHLQCDRVIYLLFHVILTTTLCSGNYYPYFIA